jgi:hypothetical protein
MKFTQAESCDGCKNTTLFREYADGVTARENNARRQTGAGTAAGQITCRGGIENPVFGTFCNARLEPSVVNEHPDLTAQVCPAQTIEQIPGFDMFASQRSATAK